MTWWPWFHDSLDGHDFMIVISWPVNYDFMTCEIAQTTWSTIPFNGFTANPWFLFMGKTHYITQRADLWWFPHNSSLETGALERWAGEVFRYFASGGGVRYLFRYLCSKDACTMRLSRFTCEYNKGYRAVAYRIQLWPSAVSCVLWLCSV